MSDYFDKTANGNTLFTKLNTLNGRVDSIEQNGAQSGVTYDVPQTLGEYYCVRKAQDLIAASSYLTATIVVPDGLTATETYNAGDTYVGIPYTSTVVDNTFVPNHVSFDTFFTALSDPNSYAYTVVPKANNTRAHLYYGSVCTEFACYCLGIKPIIHINAELFCVDGMELVTQDAQAAHIGYLLNSEGRGDRYHVMVVIGVKRLNGVVTHVTIAEQTAYSQNTRSVEYSASDFNDALSSTWTMMKYNKLEENTYEPLLSPVRMPYHNKNIMPAKGDKANWSNTENVIIHVLDAGSYTDYIVYRDGEQYSTAAINGTTIDLGVLPYGKYSMVLTDGTNKSAPVEWIVVDMNMTATARSGGIVRFTWSSKNAVPVACCWANPYTYFMMPTFEVTKEDIVVGYKDTKPSTSNNIVADITEYSDMQSQYEIWYNYYRAGSTIRPRMLFETEFGIITTDWGTSANNITYIA